MKPELMQNWFVVQNGKQIDIHVVDNEQRRELTIACDVRSLTHAHLMANAPRYKAALESIVALVLTPDPDLPFKGEDPRTKEMFNLAYGALGLDSQSETPS